MAPPTVIDLSYFSLGPNDTLIPKLPPADAYPPGHLANLICRIIFGLFSFFACLVPLRMLYRNGELAGAVFVSAVLFTIVLFLIDAITWSSLDTSGWWNGVGYCDVHIFILMATQTIVVTSVFAIMRNLAENVNMMRTGPLTRKEKKRKNLIQALIIFPVPIIQMAWMFPMSSQRYGIVPLAGCVSRTYASWPILFFIVPQVFFPCLTAVYATLIYLRFRELRKSTGNVLSVSSNPLVRSRSNRARRRLYFMSLSIILPYLPIDMYLAAQNIKTFTPFFPFDYDKIHGGVPGIPWNSVLYFVGEWTTFILVNNNWLFPLCAVPIFLFFGMTIDAINNYRRILVRCGMSRFWPWLTEEYSPDRVQQPSWVGSVFDSHPSQERHPSQVDQALILRTNGLINQNVNDEKLPDLRHARHLSDASNISELNESSSGYMSSRLLLSQSDSHSPLSFPPPTVHRSTRDVWDGNTTTLHGAPSKAGPATPNLEQGSSESQRLHGVASSRNGADVKVETEIVRSSEVVKKK
ncbi:hypothetical protein BROUX41_001940 [Berkeleyomyces rouxiae]|uniref:uncharacterized protein n=1 Tax=Berkeleyomyces rouxiae TaxID=2035830 RepID=UPI003B817A3F